MSRDELGSWGRVFSPRQRVIAPQDRSLPLPPGEGSLLPYGAGRSYGDSCLNDGNALIHTRGLDRFIAFDTATGVLRCEAGVLLADIIDFALPRGWFPPVTPGTKFVTVGGAIANDVHGKNHHRDGSFGHHVTRFELLRSDGARLACSATENAGHYRATIGGLGLTGLVTWAELRLAPLKGPWIRQTATRFASLDQFFEASAALEGAHRYVVAWLDCASRGAARGVVFAGDHDEDDNPAPTRRARAFPFEPPVSLVNGLTLRAFNAIYYRTPRAGAGDPRLVPWDEFFFPLDAMHQWNRIYGPRGFFQYQCVVPPGEAGRAALAELLDRIAASGQGSFLSVLKRLGDRPAAGMLTFPCPGYTLALDFPNQGARTLSLLDSLDAVVRAAGGRVYPAKDSRMSSAAFQAYYPEWEAFRSYIDPRFSSSFWRRVTRGESMAVAA